MSDITKNGLPIVAFSNKQEFYDWLLKNHETEMGMWLRMYRKKSGVQTIVWEEAVEVALCFGWIDSLLNKYDDVSYIQKFTPRKPKSIWSKKNCRTVERLISEKLMQPSGLKHVEAAKTDGRWEASYDSPKDMKMPDDFLIVLQDHPIAEEFYKSLNKTNLYAIAFRLNTARKPETRQRRMNKIIDTLNQRRTL